ncbi:MAG: lysophospholipid acyltransferase family protein [Candidatus Obscuribacterales bacterium]|nr:lysophospholipid acyltransferase family protein [Candidatus Obscuribacterales bacterium]
MARLFKTRELLSRFPWLDTLRMNFLEIVCSDGTTFFGNSYRITKFFSPGALELLKEGPERKPLIWSFYHGRMVGALGLHPRGRLTILMSPSRDGEMIARAGTRLGYSIARGSSKQGAVRGGLELMDAVKEGQDLVFMVDGPRGPRFEVKPGIIRMAEMTQVPILPFVCSARSTWWMPSWDKFMAPWWSTPIVYIFGEPLQVPKGASEELQEELRIELQNRMEHIRAAADDFWKFSL